MSIQRKCRQHAFASRDLEVHIIAQCLCGRFVAPSFFKLSVGLASSNREDGGSGAPASGPSCSSAELNEESMVASDGLVPRYMCLRESARPALQCGPSHPLTVACSYYPGTGNGVSRGPNAALVGIPGQNVIDRRTRRHQAWTKSRSRQLTTGTVPPCERCCSTVPVV